MYPLSCHGSRWSGRPLTSLPDLSGLEQLKVEDLPDHLKPWKDSGYKAFSVAY